MTAPKIHSDRPLWIVFLIDAFASGAAAFAPSIFATESALHGMWSNVLAVNFLLWAMVAVVGVAGWLVDLIDSVLETRSGEMDPVVPPVPDAMQEIIAASQHEHLVRGSNPSPRIAGKSESRELETQGV